MLDKITVNSVRACLNRFNDPASNKKFAESPALQTIEVKNTDIIIIINVVENSQQIYEQLRIQIIDLLKQYFPKFETKIILTAARAQPVEKISGLKNVKNIIAVASGKGGVGKSTTTVCLAQSLKSNGLTVGILDADVYGPSQTRMLNLSGKPDVNADKKLIPLNADGIKAMSIGLLVAENTPMVWRGPMVQSALQQLLHDVEWGILDVLLIDMPPGTGDAQLTIAQNANLTGAIIVTTPQDIAYIDAIKGANMFKKVAIPILGVVENMSHMVCENCDHVNHVFTKGKLRESLATEKLAIIAEVPLTPLLCRNVDTGLSNEIPSNVQVIYTQIAEKVINQMKTHKRIIPNINIA